jgi:saccharopine dehydrogenase (NAD+, L-glutamate forming)
MPTIDPRIVGQSARLVGRYGPDFTYHHHALVDHIAAAAGVGLAAGPIILATQIPPVRDALLRRFPAGAGPSAQQRAKSYFEVTFEGRAGGETVLTRVAGGDPGYGETSKMLSEAALCIAFDDNLPGDAGQVTTASAMGDALIARLIKAGITIEVLSSRAGA